MTVTHIRSADLCIHTTETNSFAHSFRSTHIKQLQYNSHNIHNILNPSPPFPREIDSPAQVRQYPEELWKPYKHHITTLLAAEGLACIDQMDIDVLRQFRTLLNSSADLHGAMKSGDVTEEQLHEIIKVA